MTAGSHKPAERATDGSGRVGRALEKLDWIAKLSKETLPGGVPGDAESIRALLNRIVPDVREACGMLRQAQASNGESDRSDLSDESDGRERTESPGLIPTHGGYRNLKSFQVAEIVYDGTIVFCDRFVPRRSRTHDQMVQAGRSGRQNIAEASVASATSKKTRSSLSLTVRDTAARATSPRSLT